ncbi:Signal recognition particle 54 kDa protein [Streptomyces griseoloalbus]
MSPGYPGGQLRIAPDPEDRRRRVRYSFRSPLSDFKNLRGKGRLSEADIDATAREIRIALLEADVALPVVRSFIKNVKERALGAEVSKALNPAQQVLKIVNDELVQILGGETRRLPLRRAAPTVIMLAGLQGAGKTTLAGSSASGSRTRATPRCWSPPTSSAPTPSTSSASSPSARASPSTRPSRATASATR